MRHVSRWRSVIPSDVGRITDTWNGGGERFAATKKHSPITTENACFIEGNGN